MGQDTGMRRKTEIQSTWRSSDGGLSDDILSSTCQEPETRGK